jgi:hypothetical protein
LVVIVFTANAQDKPSKKETIQLIEHLLNDIPNAFDEKYTIKDDIVICGREDDDTPDVYKNVDWGYLEIYSTNPYEYEEGYVTLSLYFANGYTYVYQIEVSDEPEITTRSYMEFDISEAIVEDLKNAFLRLKEIYE